MATREGSVFTTGNVLFQPESASIKALKETNLKFYTDHLPPFKDILATLNERGLFIGQNPIDFKFEDFLLVDCHIELTDESNAVELLAKPMPSMSLNTGDYPAPFLPLKDKIDAYIAILLDVFNNQLALQPYEQLCDQENVTEREHGLQCAKICIELGMPLSDVLAMLLHDIARPSIPDPKYGHAFHSQEGSDILAPLDLTLSFWGLPIDYSRFHTAAKYLLFTHCTPYQKLISDTSRISLIQYQMDQINTQLRGLEGLKSADLAYILYKLMFMRNIDDSGKVPTHEIQKKLGGEKPQYFDDPTIERMLKHQMNVHLQKLSLDKECSVRMKRFEDDIDKALTLLSRSRKYSLNPKNIYQDYAHVLPADIQAPSLQ